jgi:two-component system response regulator YesN
MLSVLVVDDEAKTRRGIRTMVNWAAHGLEFAGEATNGKDAVDLVRSRAPDIVVADIRMPLMNGIDFARTVRSERPDLRVVFLTGYSDFEYAKEAVRIGASDYLLKPFGIEELTNVLCRIRDEVHGERDRLSRERTRDRIIQSNIYAVRRELVRQSFFDGGDAEATAGVVRSLGVKLGAGPYRVIACEMRGRIGIGDDIGTGGERGTTGRQATKQAVLAEADACLAGNPHASTIEWDSKYFLILDSGTGLAPEEIVGPVRARLSWTHGVGIRTGFGAAYPYASQIPQSLQGAMKDLRFGGHPGGGDAADRDGSQAGWASAGRFPAFETEHELYAAVCRGDAPAAVDLVRGAFELARTAQCPPSQLRIASKRLVDLAYFRFVESGMLRATYERDMDEAHASLSHARNAHEMETLVLRHTTRAVEHWRFASEHQQSPVVRHAMHYVRTHSASRISLEEISEAVSVSPNYLCRVFKRETGMTVKEWHHRCRVERAKDVLHDPTARMSDAADRSGFNDYKYFNRVFKRITGMTPGQYKRIHAAT